MSAHEACRSALRLLKRRRISTEYFLWWIGVLFNDSTPFAWHGLSEGPKGRRFIGKARILGPALGPFTGKVIWSPYLEGIKHSRSKQNPCHLTPGPDWRETLPCHAILVLPPTKSQKTRRWLRLYLSHELRNQRLGHAPRAYLFPHTPNRDDLVFLNRSYEEQVHNTLFIIPQFPISRMIGFEGLTVDCSSGLLYRGMALARRVPPFRCPTLTEVESRVRDIWRLEELRTTGSRQRAFMAARILDFIYGQYALFLSGSLQPPRLRLPSWAILRKGKRGQLAGPKAPELEILKRILSAVNSRPSGTKPVLKRASLIGLMVLRSLKRRHGYDSPVASNSPPRAYIFSSGTCVIQFAGWFATSYPLFFVFVPRSPSAEAWGQSFLESIRSRRNNGQNELDFCTLLDSTPESRTLHVHSPKGRLSEISLLKLLFDLG